MTRRISKEQLQNKIDALQVALESDLLDIYYWLEELSPKSKLLFLLNDGLSTQEHNQRSKEWRMLSRKQYMPLEKNMVKMILDQLEQRPLQSADTREFAPLLLPYLQFKVESTRHQAARVIKQLDVRMIIPPILQDAQHQEKPVIMDALCTLFALSFEQQQWLELDLENCTTDLIKGLHNGLSKVGGMASPIFYALHIIRQVSPALAQALSPLQNRLVELAHPAIKDDFNYEVLMYMLNKSWQDLHPYWERTNIVKLQNYMVEKVTRNRFNSTWVEQHLRPVFKQVQATLKIH